MEDITDKRISSSLILLLAAVIWGFTFAAQRAGMTAIGPLMYNGIRFLLGALVLLPLVFFRRAKPAFNFRKQAAGGLAAGLVLAAAAGLQQFGIVSTTAGKAGFITGLYVILVPLFAVFIHQRIRWNAWLAALTATAGLVLLIVSDNFYLEPGDLLVLVSSVFWALHILVIGRLSPVIDSVTLAIMQFTVCGVLHLVPGLFLEPVDAGMVQAALIPILYGGICSIGVAYTLQIVVQKRVKPAHVSIILSSESFFAVLGGWVVLGETLSPRQIFGCVLMLAGMLIAQIWRGRKMRKRGD